MTLQQGLAFGILGAMMGLFIWGRLRYDLVAALALLAAVVVGIVPPKEAFKGFSDDIIIIVASALLVSAAIARSGAVEVAMRFASPYVGSVRAQMILLVVSVTVFSAFIKNIGALAMMIPVAFQFARRSGASVSCFLMPMAFGSLLGGIVTLVGTSPNVIVARVRQELVGEPFQMFDFTPVGLGIAAAGVAFLIVGYRLLPARKGSAGMDAALEAHEYTTEAKVTETSPVAGQTVSDLRKLSEDGVSVVGIVRKDDRSARPLPDVEIRPDDTLLLQGDPKALDSLVAHAELRLTRDDRPLEKEEAADEVGAIEAVIGSDSALADRTVEQVALYQRFGVNLLGVSRRGERITERLRSVRLRPGDTVVLQGVLRFLPETLKALNLLPLAERSIPLGSARRGSIAVAILAITVLLIAFDVLPIAIAFFGAAVLLVLFGALPIREAYQSIEWPILVMLGALIPVSDAIRTTGATELLAAWLSQVAGMLPPAGAVALVMIAAMAVTPFLNNAATVLVMAPIAASFATQLGYRPDAFLMATAIGAACDFLTPIGHQCNTLVMGPGGYKFGDYSRLGAPLSLIVILVGVPLILIVWPIAKL
ncbi:MAG: permease [Microvirga sp.]|jgi:di/tricarboxylate transporter|nr:permease [Microvirga sp.]